MSDTGLSDSKELPGLRKNKNSFPSFSDLTQLLNTNLSIKSALPLKYGSYVASLGSSLQNQVDTIADVMKQSKGRDKICNFIQYTADFYYVCHKNSNIDRVKSIFKQDQFPAARVAKKIRDSMKNGRKIFKFLKFVGEFKKFMKVIKSGKPLSLKATLLLCVVCRFFYYVLDNILWAISIGNLSEVFSHDLSKKVKSLKDSFLLIKAFLKVSEASYGFLFKRNKEQAVLFKLCELGNTEIIRNDTQTERLCSALFRAKNKRRSKLIKLLTTAIRILMLCKRQKIPPLYSLMNNISYSFGGLVCAAVGLVKTFQPKIDVINITKGSGNLPEYEELSRKQYQQLQSLPRQKSMIRRSDSTLSDLLSMESDEERSDDSYNSDSSLDSSNSMKEADPKEEAGEQEYQDDSDGGSVHNFDKSKKTVKRARNSNVNNHTNEDEYSPNFDKSEEMIQKERKNKQNRGTRRIEKWQRAVTLQTDVFDELNWERDDKKQAKELDQINQIFNGQTTNGIRFQKPKKSSTLKRISSSNFNKQIL